MKTKIKVNVVKRKGHEETFDERKVYASCYAACLSAGNKHKESEKVSEKVSKEIKNWIKKEEFVTSDQVFHRVAAVLEKYNHKAAYMYRTHRDIG